MENQEIDIGITAYNEEKNIGHCLDSIFDQAIDNSVKLNSIFVVASGCIDRTEDIVLKKAKSYPHIKLIKEEKRSGKASAINLILENSKADILIFSSADVIFTKNTLIELIKPFRNRNVGATSSFPISLNDDNQLVGYASKLIWQLHDIYSRNYATKLTGELFAIRPKLVKRIPKNTNCDDAMIEKIILNKGYKIVYANKARIYIMGPGTVIEFIKQRRRVLAGYSQIKKLTGKSVKTANWLTNFKLIGIYIKRNFGFKHLLSIFFSSILEFIAYFLALINGLRGKYENIWPQIKSTKSLKS